MNETMSPALVEKFSSPEAMMLYNRVLTKEEMESVETYLAKMHSQKKDEAPKSLWEQL